MNNTHPRNWLIYSTLVTILLGLSVLSLCMGAGQAGYTELKAWLLNQANPMPTEELTLLFETLRLPRLEAAVLVGAALGVAGAFMQTATRNILAEPGLLGINAGAALGVVIGIAFWSADGPLAFLPWAAGGALFGHICVLLIAHAPNSNQAPLRLVLAGAALSATFHGLGAIILLSQAANYDQFRFWELGTLSNVTPEAMNALAPVLGLGMLAAFCMVRPLTALRLGDDLARTLGHNPKQLRILIVFIVALLAGAALALVGPIAFLGLLAPFLARALTRQQLAHTLMVSALMGALLLLAADILARQIAQPFETPVGIFLSALGAPLLIWMVRRGPQHTTGTAAP